MGQSCDSCTKKRVIDLHPYVNDLFFLRNLIERGYPKEKLDIYFETWVDLIKLENTIAEAHRKHRERNKP